MNALERLSHELIELSEHVREEGFAFWCEQTVFPQAVNRWIEQVGESVK